MEARIKIAESGGATLNIYPRSGSGTFYYEIRDSSYKDRGSLRTKEEDKARGIDEFWGENQFVVDQSGNRFPERR